MSSKLDYGTAADEISIPSASNIAAHNRRHSDMEETQGDGHSHPQHRGLPHQSSRESMGSDPGRRLPSMTASERRYQSHNERASAIHTIPPAQLVPSETGSTAGGDEDMSLLDGGLHPEPNCVDKFLNFLLPPGSIPASSFNLCAATLGAGTLGLPYAMDHTGALVGSITLVLCGAVTVYTCDLLILTLEKTGYNTYEQLSRYLIGERFEKAVAALIILFCWGVACVYVVVIGTIIEPLQSLEALPQGVWGDRLMTFVFWLAFMLPLSLLRDINSLRYASLCGFLATLYLVIAIIANAAGAGHDKKEKKNIDLGHAIDFNFWSSLTVFSFSYCCQTNAFEIYHELSEPTPVRMKKAAALGMTFCTSLYIMAGIAGLASFGHTIESNILGNFHKPQNTPYLLMAFIAITFTVTMAFPVAIFPTRDAVLQMMGYATAYDTPTRVRILVCVLLASSALILGLFVPNIQVLFSILGGVCGSSLGYCMPVLFAWKAGVLAWTNEDGKPTGLGMRANFLLAWFVFSVGAIFGTVGTITTLINLANGDSSSSPNHSNSTANATNSSGGLNLSSMVMMMP